MLALDSPLGTVAGTVLFGDHADEKIVHVVPTRPRLVRADGRPDAALRLVPPQIATEQGAALFSFSTELTVDEDQRGAISEHLEDLGITDVRLAPVQWRAGRAVFAAALTEGDGFVERLLGDVPVGDGGDNRAVFSLLLSEDGAGMVAGLLDDVGPSPLGVRYELTYLGLRPALDVRISADYGRIFDEFSVGFEFGVAYNGVGVRAGVDIATKRLVENGAITVEVTHFTDDADFRARVDEAVQWFQERLLRDFFTSSLRPPGQDDLLARAAAAAAALGAATLQDALGDATTAAALARQLGLPLDALQGLGRGGSAPGAGGGESTFALNLQFQLRDIHIDERKHVELDWREAHAEERTAAPQALLRDLGAVPVVTDAGETASLWQRMDLEVRPLGDFSAVGAERMDVRIAYPDELAPDRVEDTLTFLPGDDTPRRFAAFTDGRPPTFRYRTQVQFHDGGPVPGPPLEDGPWRSGSGDQLAVHVMDDVDLLDLEVTTGTIDLAAVPQIQVDLRVDGLHATSLTLTADTPALRHRRRLRPLAPGPGVSVAPPAIDRASYRCTWFLADGRQVIGEETQVDSPLLPVPGPWRAHRRVRVFPMLPQDVLEATATLSLVGSPRREVVHFGPDSERRSTEVVLPSLTDPPAAALVETFVLLASGQHFSDRIETEAAVVMVQARAGQHRRVEVRLVAGDDLRAHGVIAVGVQLLDEFGQPADSISFTPSDREPRELLVPLADDGTAAPARYLVTRFRPDGVAVPDPVLETIEDRLLVPAVIPAGSIPPQPEPGQVPTDPVPGSSDPIAEQPVPPESPPA